MAPSHRKSKSTRPPKQASGTTRRPPLPPRPSPRTPAVLASAPDIDVGYGAAGRDTLAAIAEEVLSIAQAAGRGDEPGKSAAGAPAARKEIASRPRLSTLGYEERPVERLQVLVQPGRSGSSPELAFGSAPAGRETLAAIAEELAAEQPTGVRKRLSDDSPEITMQVRPAGRETLAAIEAELESTLSPAAGAPQSSPRPREAGEEIFEMVTFVVRITDTARLSTQQARRNFVAERLMHRLPVDSLDDVDRVDVTPWTVRGTVIVRVWCKVPEA